MAHCVHGFVALRSDLEKSIATLPKAGLCELSQGFAFVPITDAMVDPSEPVSSQQMFSELTRRLEEWGLACSANFSIVYLETEYFGGLGSQAAIVWRAGKTVFGPAREKAMQATLERPINGVLRCIGVQRGTMSDEFQAIGLHRFRNDDDWLSRS
jgi:hypothetical protein